MDCLFQQGERDGWDQLSRSLWKEKKKKTLTQTSQLSQDEWKGELSSLQHGLIKTTLQPFNLVGNHISSTVLANRLYPSGRGYLGDYELCHMNMTLKAK